MLLTNLALFVRIAEKGGIAVAGRDMGLSAATTSERLAALEAHYGTKLLNRTTRAISLTEEGRDLLEGARHLLAEAEELDARIKMGIERVAGPIRISAPIDLGRARISKVLDGFLDDHPDVSIDLQLGDGYVDLAAQGFDLAIRYGDLADSSLIVRQLSKSARIVCAAPAYLERHGTPQRPDDLESHNCLLMRFGGEADRVWRFVIDGKTRALTVRGNRIANDGGLVREWCIAGHGIARKSQWDIADDLAAGRLVPLLREYETPPVRLQAVFPQGRGHIRRVRLLLDTLADAFHTRPAA